MSGLRWNRKIRGSSRTCCARCLGDRSQSRTRDHHPGAPCTSPGSSVLSVFSLGPYRSQSGFQGGIRHWRQGFALHCNPSWARHCQSFPVFDWGHPSGCLCLSAGCAQLPGRAAVTRRAIRARREGQALLALQQLSHTTTTETGYPKNLQLPDTV